ncbi:cofilin, partial [Coemansia brasiliensis]
SSGIEVSSDCTEAFQLIREHKCKFAIFKISDDKLSVVVENTSNEARKDASGNDIPLLDDMYEEFLARIPKDEGRFAVYDFDYEVEGGKRNRLLFYSWAPDSASIKNKMLYASTKQNFSNKLTGVAANIQATDESDLSHESVLEKMLASSR